MGRNETLKLPNAKFENIDFNGGLDVVTPEIKTAPGTLRESQNYEVNINGGYVRCVGYERVDGRFAPSSGIYSVMRITLTGTINVGDIVTGATSGATATVVGMQVATLPNHVIMTKITGTFLGPDDDPVENVQVSAVTQATTLSGSVTDGADTAILHGQYTALAANDYRDDIGVVPGDGPVLGVWMLNDITYAFRNNVGNTAADLYKTSAAGWVQCPLGEELAFTSAGAEYATGTSTITGVAGSVDSITVNSVEIMDGPEFATGSVELTAGGSGSVDGITINSLEVMSGAEAFDTSLSVTAANVALNIRLNTTVPNYTATSSGAVITIKAATGGVGPNGFVVTSALTTITTTNINMAGGAESIAIPFDTDLTTTAAAVVTSINSKTSVPNYTATSALGVITITPSDIGTGPNTFVVLTTATTLGTSDVAMAGGATATEIAEGDTVTGETSTATAVITRVMVETGSWGSGTAQGKLIFAGHTGTFQAETLKVSTDLNKCTIAGDASSIVQQPNGDYEFVTNHFGGVAGSQRMYGCDTASRGFEFDGAVFAPITTGMAQDTPNHVAAFENHLFFAFDGSAQHSGIGTPYSFSPIFGASELAVGDNITAFKGQPGSEGNSSLAIFSRNKINILYGTSVADWKLVDYREEVGAYSHSVQEFGMTMMLDDRGVANLLTVQAYGNFQHNSLSKLIQPWVSERKSIITTSCIARDKSQYRLFFSDNYALYVTTDNRKVIGLMPQLFAHPAHCSYSLETSTGAEQIMFGSDDGFVYQMERGTSFDGLDIESYLIFHYSHSKTPRWNKHYKSATLEITGTGYADFNFTYELGYTDANISQPTQILATADLSTARWDSFTWDAFFWDGQVLKPAVQRLAGTAENISLIIRADADYHKPLTFSGAQLRYLMRRQLR